TLDLARRFSATIQARNSTGPFGRGWYTPWQSHIVVESGGDLVTLISEAGSARLFTRDTRNGRYFSQADDSSVLSAVCGGVDQFRDSNGIIARFRASDGQIDYIEDPNGNRLTPAYDSQG